MSIEKIYFIAVYSYLKTLLFVWWYPWNLDSLHPGIYSAESLDNILLTKESSGVYGCSINWFLVQ